MNSSSNLSILGRDEGCSDQSYEYRLLRSAKASDTVRSAGTKEMGLIFVSGSRAFGTNQAPHLFHRASPELKLPVEDNELQHIRTRRGTVFSVPFVVKMLRIIRD
jgi:hypothetical protein